ncbi:retinol dehydrogenase 12 [Stemphylium lycopersici]|nr:retinol dehydrogenase 12 [Stemphylium lycopersici]
MASNLQYNKNTGALEVASAYASQAKGKTVLVTGVSKGGIGEAITRAFAHGGASKMIITGRDDTRMSAITELLSSDYPSVQFQPHKLDLTSLAAVRRSAEEILEDDKIPQIDILVGNAGGAWDGSRTVTVDGIETHLAVNHLGHHLFTQTLLPKLQRAAKNSAPGATRVVMVSSLACVISPFRFSDYNLEDRPLAKDEGTNWEVLNYLMGIEQHEGYEFEVAYGQSKTANVLFAKHLNKLLSSDGIYAFALHPGAVQSRASDAKLRAMTEEQKSKLKISWDKTLDQGAATVLVAALDPGLKPENGVFLNDCQLYDAPPYATDAEKAEKLWKLSEDLIAEKLSYIA